ncbi:hypothetical protein AB6D89_23340 [Vibrio splendidus]
MLLDSSKYEVIDDSSIVVCLDCIYITHTLILNKADLVNLISLLNFVGSTLTTENGIEFELLGDEISFSYKAHNGKRLDVYPNPSNLKKIVMNAYDELIS